MNKVSNLRKLICNQIFDDDDKHKKKDDDDDKEIWSRLVIEKTE
jgi:hypothetical protein